MKPGSLVKSGLEFMGVDPASCNCVERAAQMDEWGVDGCRKNIETIVGWFVDEGRRHQLPEAQTPQFRNILRGVLKFGISRSEQLLALEAGAVDTTIPPFDGDDGSGGESSEVVEVDENDVVEPVGGVPTAESEAIDSTGVGEESSSESESGGEEAESEETSEASDGLSGGLGS